MQVLVHLVDLMSRNCFEAISSFFHVVTSEVEAQLMHDPLEKIRPLHDSIKAECLEFYHPLRELSIDEWMVKCKARSHFRQYIRNKPTKAVLLVFRLCAARFQATFRRKIQDARECRIMVIRRLQAQQRFYFVLFLSVAWSSQTALHLPISLRCTTLRVCLTIRRKRRLCRSI